MRAWIKTAAAALVLILLSMSTGCTPTVGQVQPPTTTPAVTDSTLTVTPPNQQQPRSQPTTEPVPAPRSDPATTDPKPPAAVGSTDHPPTAADSPEAGPTFGQPLLITSIGQSADALMIKTLMQRTAFVYRYDPLLRAEQLTVGVKTLIVVLGGSAKGLGAAGVKAEDEIARARDLIAKASEMRIPIIAMHIGGEGRRGSLSDTFVREGTSLADYLIVVRDGNKDGLFTRIAAESQIPLDLVPSIAASLEPLNKIIK